MKTKIFISDIESIRVVIKHIKNSDQPMDQEPLKILHLIVNYSDSEVLQGVLDICDDINERNDNGETPLHVAVKKGYPRMMNILLKNGADKNAVDKKGNTPLHLIVIGNSMNKQDLLEVLVQYNPNGNLKNLEGKTPLILTCQMGEMTMVFFYCLLGIGVNVNLSDDTTYTTLRSVSSSVNTFGRPKKGCSPLFYSILHNHVDNAKFLLEVNADMRGFFTAYWRSQKSAAMTKVLISYIMLRKTKEFFLRSQEVHQFLMHSMESENIKKFANQVRIEVENLKKTAVGRFNTTLWHVAASGLEELYSYFKFEEVRDKMFFYDDFKSFPVFGQSFRRKSIHAYCRAHMCC